MSSTTWYDPHPPSTVPTNPWVSGGAFSTPRDYAKLLRAFLGGSFITNMTAFTQPRTIGLPRVFVPASTVNWEYALGSFVECDTPSACATSKINSSRSEEHTSELQSLMRISYAVFCLNKQN